jgi:hypothetical protein
MKKMAVAVIAAMVLVGSASAAGCTIKKAAYSACYSYGKDRLYSSVGNIKFDLNLVSEGPCAVYADVYSGVNPYKNLSSAEVHKLCMNGAAAALTKEERAYMKVDYDCMSLEIAKSAK